jgi:hypothetical protein
MHLRVAIYVATTIIQQGQLIPTLVHGRLQQLVGAPRTQSTAFGSFVLHFPQTQFGFSLVQHFVGGFLHGH